MLPWLDRRLTAKRRSSPSLRVEEPFMSGPSGRVLPPVTSSLQATSAVAVSAARTAQRIIESSHHQDVEPAGTGAPPTPTALIRSARAAPQASSPGKLTLGALAAMVENRDETDTLDEFDAGSFLRRHTPQKRVTGAALAGVLLKRLRAP